MPIRLSLFFALLLLTVPCSSVVIHVPTDHANIQAAITAAVHGDTVMIADGTYTGEGNRDISFQGKAITVTSLNGPQNCTIDCQGTVDAPHRGFIFENDETANSVLQGLTVRGGFANQGGGMYVADYSSPRITGCHLIENAATDSGGGAYLINNTLFENCTVQGNHADDSGGGLYCTDNVRVDDSIVSDNSADKSGGGIFCEGRVAISNSTIDHNYCDSDCNYYFWEPCGGGGVTLGEYASMQDCLIEFNQAKAYGGGVYGEDHAIIRHCIVRNNALEQSEAGGGGIYLSVFSGEPLVYKSIVSGNRASGPECKGGGIYCIGSLIVECEITGNTATGFGGGLYQCDSSITACEISGNDSGSGGGGIYSIIQGEIANCLITNNTADYSAGVQMYVENNPSRSSDLRNCTIAHNTARNTFRNCGGVTCTQFPFALASVFNISDCIIWQNSGIQLNDSSGDAELNVSYTCIQDGFEGTGNISTDPLFTLGPRGAFYLSRSSAGQNADSPCIDSGSEFSDLICFNSYPGTLCMNELTTQRDKSPDIDKADMGFHYFSSPADDVTVRIQIPSDYYSPGASCSCSVIVTNGREQAIADHPLFVLLYAYGSVFFAPGFTPDMDHFLSTHPTFPVGQTTVTVLPEFTWPTGVGSGTDAAWCAALLNPDLTELFGDLDLVSFAWGE